MALTLLQWVLVIFLSMALALCAIPLVQWSIRKWKNMPPGPIGLPFVGYFPFLGTDPHIRLDHLSKIYGPVFSLYMGSRYTVVLCNIHAVKAAFKQEVFLDRPEDIGFNRSKGSAGLAQVSGNVWKEQRKFTVGVLKDLVTNDMEPIIKEELKVFLVRLGTLTGTPIDLTHPLTTSISNNVTTMLYGRRFAYDEEARTTLDSILFAISEFLGQVTVHVFLPEIKGFLHKFKLYGYGEKQKPLMKLTEFNKKQIEDHKVTLQEDNPRDYIDRYLIEESIQNNRKDRHFFNDIMLLGHLRNMFGAGSDTTRSTIRWSLLLMALHPDIQKKVQLEIDEVVGRNREPQWADNALLSMVHATLMEVHRWVSVLSINMLRCNSADTTLLGYHIPKGSVILANLWSVHHDPAEWTNPHHFDPGRFLDADGKVVRPDAFIPFSFGKRSCPGEGLARLVIFLYFVSIFQKFSVRLPDGVSQGVTQGRLGVSLHPKAHQLIVEERT